MPLNDQEFDAALNGRSQVDGQFHGSNEIAFTKYEKMDNPLYTVMRKIDISKLVDWLKRNPQEFIVVGGSFDLARDGGVTYDDESPPVAVVWYDTNVGFWVNDVFPFNDPNDSEPHDENGFVNELHRLKNTEVFVEGEEGNYEQWSDPDMMK
jgi:hypothetical protein